MRRQGVRIQQAQRAPVCHILGRRLEGDLQQRPASVLHKDAHAKIAVVQACGVIVANDHDAAPRIPDPSLPWRKCVPCTQLRGQTRRHLYSTKRAFPQRAQQLALAQHGEARLQGIDILARHCRGDRDCIQRHPQLTCPSGQATPQRCGIDDGMAHGRLHATGRRKCSLEGVNITDTNGLIDRHQRGIGTKAVAEPDQIPAWIGFQRLHDIDQDRTGTDRGELVGIPHQHQHRFLAQGIEQGVQHAEIQHRGLIHHHDVGGQRLPRVEGESAMATAATEQAMHRHRLDRANGLQMRHPCCSTRITPLQLLHAKPQGFAQPTRCLAGGCSDPDLRQAAGTCQMLTRETQQHPQDRGGLAGTRATGQHHQPASEHLPDCITLTRLGLAPTAVEQVTQVGVIEWPTRQRDRTPTLAKGRRHRDLASMIAQQVEMIAVQHEGLGCVCLRIRTADQSAVAQGFTLQGRPRWRTTDQRLRKRQGRVAEAIGMAHPTRRLGRGGIAAMCQHPAPDRAIKLTPNLRERGVPRHAREAETLTRHQRVHAASCCVLAASADSTASSKPVLKRCRQTPQGVPSGKLRPTARMNRYQQSPRCVSRT